MQGFRRQGVWGSVFRAIRIGKLQVFVFITTPVEVAA